MVRKFILTICILILAVTVSAACKKKDNADGGVPPLDEAAIAEIFGGGGEGDGNYLDLDKCGDGTCAVGETPENCAADCAGTAPGGKTNPIVAEMKVSTLLSKVDGKYPIKEHKSFEVTPRVTGYDDHQLTFEDPVVDNEALIDVVVIDDFDGENNKVKYEVTALALDGDELETTVTFKAIDPEDAETIFTIEITILVKKNELKNNSIASIGELKKNEEDFYITFDATGGSKNYEYLPVDVVEVLADVETVCPPNVCIITRVTEEESVRDEVVFTKIGDYKVYSAIEDIDLGYVATDEEGHSVKVKEKTEGMMNVYLLDTDFQTCLSALDCKILKEETSTDTFEIHVPYGKLIGIEIAGDAEYDCSSIPVLEDLPVDVQIVGDKTYCLIEKAAEDLKVEADELSYPGQIVRVESPHSDTRNFTFSILTFEPDPCHKPMELIKVVAPVSDGATAGTTPDTNETESNLLESEHEVVLGSSTDISFKVQGGGGPFDVTVSEDLIVNKESVLEYEVACPDGYTMGEEDGCPVLATHEHEFLFNVKYITKSSTDAPFQDYIINVRDEKCGGDVLRFPVNVELSYPRRVDEKIAAIDGMGPLRISYRIWTEWTDSNSYAQLTLISGQIGVAMISGIDVDGDDPTSREYRGLFPLTPSVDKEIKIENIKRFDFDYWDYSIPDMRIELTYAIVASRNFYAVVSHGEERCEGKHETKVLSLDWKLRCKPGDLYQLGGCD